MLALEAWRDVDSLFRLNLFFFSGCLPLLGAATVWRSLSTQLATAPASSATSLSTSLSSSVSSSLSTSPPVSNSTIIGLVGVALCFHTFAYVLNDVVDLPSDRSNPWRRYDPMVRGALKRGHALAIALLAAALSFPLIVALGGATSAVIVLLCGYACMAAYDVFGKRTPLPPLTDVAQGAAWGCLVVVGAIVAGGAPNTLTWVATAHTVLFVLAMNGVHGGLRDLAHDMAHRARTTAIVLGARPSTVGDGRVYMPFALRAFATAATLAVMAVVTVPLLVGGFDYSGPERQKTLLAVVLVDAGVIALLAGILRPEHLAWPTIARLHIVLMFALLPAALWPGTPAPIRLALLAVAGVSLAALIASDTWFKISTNSPNWGGALK